jgi:hypothetical protein
MDQQLSSMEKTVNEIRDALQRRNDPAASRNVNTVRVEGVGTMWHGFAIGMSIAGLVAGMVWIAWVASEARVSMRQAEAYRAAVYVVAPKFSEQIEKELERQKERETE